MDSRTLFAQPVITPEATIDRVRQDLLAEWSGLGPSPREISEAAQASVHALWESKIKLFVPVLALRDARSSLGTMRLQPASAVTSMLSRLDPVPAVARDPQDESLDITDDTLDVTNDTFDLSSDMHL